MFTAVIDEDALCSPTVGVFTPATVPGGPVRPGEILGTLLRAGRTVSVVAPAGLAGAAMELRPAGSWVQYGDVLCRVGEGGSVALVSSQDGPSDVPTGHTAVRADTDGTAYMKPEPTAAPFVSVGDAVTAGTTVALVEVMKTFTPVRVTTDGVVVQVRVGDGDPVSANQVLLVLAPSK